MSTLANIATNQLKFCKKCKTDILQNNSSSTNNLTNNDSYKTNHKTCDMMNLDSLWMLYTGNALSLFLLTLAQRQMWDDVLPLLRAMCG